MIWLMVIMWVLGVAIGYLICEAITKAKLSGCLRIDDSDPNEPPYIFLELEENPEVLKRKKYVTLQVNLKSYISHK